MKTYQKPQVLITALFNSDKIANGGLGDWLTDTAQISEANITTYVMNS